MGSEEVAEGGDLGEEGLGGFSLNGGEWLGRGAGLEGGEEAAELGDEQLELDAVRGSLVSKLFKVFENALKTGDEIPGIATIRREIQLHHP
jgi:hypothetical protein